MYLAGFLNGRQVTGIDNMNDYYDVSLKEARLARLTGQENFRFVKMDLADRKAMEDLFAEGRFDRVVNLAAQAGVRYSLINPHSYIESNILGFTNILEGCRHNGVEHLVYASSSSVYGANETMTFSVHDNVDHPLSLYAASKKANELMAHTYSHLYRLPTTGLRFFTVYGPWGRPDMALFLFTDAILKGKPIQVFNYGKHRRDFTFIDDIVEGVIRTLDHVAEPNPDWSGLKPDPGSSRAPWRVYNIGNSQPVELMDYIGALERELGKNSRKKSFCRSSPVMCLIPMPMLSSSSRMCSTSLKPLLTRASNGLWRGTGSTTAFRRPEPSERFLLPHSQYTARSGKGAALLCRPDFLCSAIP